MSAHAAPPLLRVQQVASEVATKDQRARADLVLDVAIKHAAQVLREPMTTPLYRHTRAALLMQRAAESADRILGRNPR